MQTKLRSASILFAASLLGASLTSAATHQANKTHAAPRKSKPTMVGTASWYGKQHQGRKMANRQRFDSRKLTAASWYFPLGTRLQVVNLENGETVFVTITDRGPNRRLHRIIDLSEAAALQLDYVDQGLTKVLLAPLPDVQTETAVLDSQLIAPVFN